MAEAGRDGLLEPRADFLNIFSWRRSSIASTVEVIGGSDLRGPIRSAALCQRRWIFHFFSYALYLCASRQAGFLAFLPPGPHAVCDMDTQNHVHYIAIVDDQRVWALQKLAVAFTTAATFSTCEGAERRVSGGMHETGGRFA
jgi:hypothetical protein